jgi:phosphoribosyl-ATP pyrophosphohydrolase
MIIPSIDIQDGQTVQLVGGRQLALEAGDPVPLAKRFGLAGEVAVIDLDAARGRGSNSAVLEKLLPLARCRIGGGIRDVDTAVRWLDRGAAKVILGTAAVPEVLQNLPKDRVIAAVDAVNGEVVTEGWETRTGASVDDTILRLRDLVSGFLVTFVEREGRMSGIDLSRVRELRDLVGGAQLTVAGGIRDTEEIAQLDEMGVDAQVGMALYQGHIELADAIVAPMRSERTDGLWPTVVCDERGVALGLVWSNRESVREAVRLCRGVYHSRSRGLWIKGETSGDTQELLGIRLDCDRDALRFQVRQAGIGFCHTGSRSCWGEDRGLAALLRVIESRRADAPAGSYTRRLLEDSGLLDEKLREEADELTRAGDRGEIVWEAADLFYFASVKLAREGVSLEEVEAELDRRAHRVTRRYREPSSRGGEKG